MIGNQDDMRSTEGVLVYQAVNIKNGKSYIGFTSRGLAAREASHRAMANGKGKGYLLHHAIRKYGQENVCFEVMANFHGDEDLAKLYECEAIAAYKPEYNLTYGGEGGTLAKESRAKISAANKGRKMPPSFYEKRRVFLTGRKHTEEAKAKIAAANRGRPSPLKGVSPSNATRIKLSAANKGQVPWILGQKHSPETIVKMSLWQIGRKLPEKHLANVRRARREAWAQPTEAMRAAVRENNRKAIDSRKIRVVCIEDMREFFGASEADRFYGFKIGTVSRILKSTIENKTGLTFEKKGVGREQ